MSRAIRSRLDRLQRAMPPAVHLVVVSDYAAAVDVQGRPLPRAGVIVRLLPDDLRL
ncbi:hypothetical protein [Sphingosinicella sp.]|uniref:hypothetical protein n=1 Tax=Sphingosinicella sp. TaxID=1917971 RepID=UPI0026279330|nr:hypothetical protein [Sphingosinicella sp.]